MVHNCLDCKEILTDTEFRDFGGYCNACIVKHQTYCKRRGCFACLRSKCWQCSGTLEKITVDLTVDKDHPYPEWYWKCCECGEYQVKCKYCRETTVDWWHEGEDVWDDIYQCESCGAPFCPGCNQHGHGCKFIEDEDEFYCTSCGPSQRQGT